MRTGALVAAGALALTACAGGTPGGSTADAARDAAQLVDPAELVALVGGAGTANRLVAFAADRGYTVERRDPLPGLGLELVTLRLRGGRRTRTRRSARSRAASRPRRSGATTPTAPVPRRPARPSRGPTPTRCSAGPPPAARRGRRSG